MSFNLVDMFKHSFTERTAERATLIVPIHDLINKPESQPILAKAADQIANSHLVWKWHCYDGKDKLCSWDAKQQVFLRGTLEDWCVFIGRNWVIKDPTNREYLGPSVVVCDRLVSVVLQHPDTPEASWSLQLAMKRKAAHRE